ncbi:hypothetical protein CRUP_007209, partial [Coryphaenoides rupestris]
RRAPTEAQRRRRTTTTHSTTSSSSLPSSVGPASPADDDTGDVRPGGGGEEEEEGEGGTISPAEAPDHAEHQPPGEETPGRMAHRTFSERLPGNRHSAAGRSVATRSARVRGVHQRPMSEAWIGLYRVNSRHGSIRCPFCTKPFPGGRIEDHLLSCLTSPPLPYNTDVLSKDIGECSICLEDLVQGETIARLACLCVYHKRCIDSWAKHFCFSRPPFSDEVEGVRLRARVQNICTCIDSWAKVKPCCPEHPFD